MDIDYFREFLVLVDTKNYWEASARLFIGQSTLSKHIKQMEQELGALLFTRTSRKVELTTFGKLLIPHAQTIVATKYSYTEQFAIEKDSQNGKFILGAIPSMPQYFITDLIIGFNNLYPTSLVKVVEADSLELKELLRQHRCELAFIREPRDSKAEDNDLVKLHYMDDKMIALLPLSHPLAQQETIHLEQLAEDKFILLKQNTMLYQLCVDTCERVGFKPQITFDCHRIDTIQDLVTQGMGVSLLMEPHCRHPKHAGPHGDHNFAVVDVVPQIRTTISLCYCKSTTLSSSTKKFIQYFENQKEILINSD